jgi:hypothetical protein
MNYFELQDHFSSHINDYLSGNTGMLTKALIPYSETATLCALLDSALRQEKWLGSIIRYSYLHPNGFTKIVLLSANHFQLRLHMWRPCDQPRIVPENVHNHRWDFSSVLLTGGYRYQEFVAASRGQTFHSYGYRSQRGTASYSLTARGQRTLICAFDAYLQAGSSYTLRADVLHRVIGDPARTTATLVLQGPRVRDNVDVFAETALDTGPQLPLPRFTAATLIQHIRDLTRTLGGG